MPSFGYYSKGEKEGERERHRECRVEGRGVELISEQTGTLFANPERISEIELKDFI